MEAKFYKRALAYLIDVIVVVLLFMVIAYFIPQSKNIYSLQTELDWINESLMLNEMDLGIYFHRIGIVYYDMYKVLMVFNILSLVIGIFYFGILQWKLNGQTLGKKLFKIQVISNDDYGVSLPQLFVRGLIINGFFFAIYSLLMSFLLAKYVYFVTVVLVGMIQVALFLVSVFMVFYSRKKRGLHDIIGRTKVIEKEGN